jgi:hypothetical protein
MIRAMTKEIGSKLIGIGDIVGCWSVGGCCGWVDVDGLMWTG